MSDPRVSAGIIGVALLCGGIGAATTSWTAPPANFGIFETDVMCGIAIPFYEALCERFRILQGLAGGTLTLNFVALITAVSQAMGNLKSDAKRGLTVLLALGSLAAAACVGLFYVTFLEGLWSPGYSLFLFAGCGFLQLIAAVSVVFF